MVLNFVFGSSLLFALIGSASGTVEVNAFLPPSVNLLNELEAAVGRDNRDATERRVTRLEDAMTQMFEALPKNSYGNLNAAGVQYMIRRLFVQRYGWRVRGLDGPGETATPSWSMTSAIDEHFGVNVNGIVNKTLSEKGFSLRHSAVLAATLENFVHTEAVDRLEAAFRLRGLNQETSDWSESDLSSVLDTYLVIYVYGLDSAAVTEAEVRELTREAPRRMHFWSQTRQFLVEILETVMAQESGVTSRQAMLKALDLFSERYGKWQHTAVNNMKDILMKLETTPGTARVPLEKFYESKLNGTKYFTESPKYLRALGSLDDSNPEFKTVIIPNYVNGLNNCIHPSKFYSVCGIDECDSLLSHIEGEVRAPSARPNSLLNIVSGLPSSTMKAPRIMSDLLVERLSEIAERHGGEVSLHGRLFAQWMHHAYPYECNYPHISGATTPMRRHDFEQTGEVASLESWEMERLIKEAQERGMSGDIAMTWSPEEELFAGRHEHNSVGSREFFMCMVLLSFIAYLVKPSLTASGKSTNYSSRYEQ